MSKAKTPTRPLGAVAGIPSKPIVKEKTPASPLKTKEPHMPPKRVATVKTPAPVDEPEAVESVADSVAATSPVVSDDQAHAMVEQIAHDREVLTGEQIDEFNSKTDNLRKILEVAIDLSIQLPLDYDPLTSIAKIVDQAKYLDHYMRLMQREDKERLEASKQPKQYRIWSAAGNDLTELVLSVEGMLETMDQVGLIRLTESAK